MTTRPVEQIQRAHDLLVPLVTGKIRTPSSSENMRDIHVALDVLCWALNHDHNCTFAENLQRLERELLKRGYQLEDHGN